MHSVGRRLRSAAQSGLPGWADGVLAAGLAVAGLLDATLLGLTPELTGGVAVLPACLLPLVLAWRRRSPLPAAVAMATLLGLQAVVVAPTTSLTQVVTLLLLSVSVAAHEPVGRALLGLAALVLAVGLVSVRSAGSAAQALSVVPFLAVPFAAGLALRAARGYAARLEQLTEELVEERRRVAGLAVAEERRRIARDLHDVVAHGVGVMTVQAGGARTVLGSDLGRAREALVAIESTGRTTLAELELLVGLLRAPGETVDAAPPPLLCDLGPLVDRLRTTGTRLDYRAAGEGDRVPPPVQTTAFRIVQEAVTNAVKHAPGAPVHVRCRVLAGQLHLDVTDEGTSTRPAGAGGNGLVGMHERVALFAGELRAGPLPTGGWAVCARLPLIADRAGG